MVYFLANLSHLPSYKKQNGTHRMILNYINMYFIRKLLSIFVLFAIPSSNKHIELLCLYGEKKKDRTTNKQRNENKLKKFFLLNLKIYSSFVRTKKQKKKIKTNCQCEYTFNKLHYSHETMIWIQSTHEF